AIHSLEQTHVIATSIRRAPSGIAIGEMHLGLPWGNGRFGGETVPRGEPSIIGPTHPHLDDWRNRCRAMRMSRPIQMDVAPKPDDLIDAITANIGIGAAVMSDIAASCDNVSPSFTVGVQF